MSTIVSGKKFFFFFYIFIEFFYIIYIVYQCDLPPLRPHCVEAPGRDSNPGRTAQRQGQWDTTPRPPHLLKNWQNKILHVQRKDDILIVKISIGKYLPHQSWACEPRPARGGTWRTSTSAQPSDLEYRTQPSDLEYRTSAQPKELCI